MPFFKNENKGTLKNTAVPFCLFQVDFNFKRRTVNGIVELFFRLLVVLVNLIQYGY